MFDIKRVYADAFDVVVAVHALGACNQMALADNAGCEKDRWILSALSIR